VTGNGREPGLAMRPALHNNTELAGASAARGSNGAARRQPGRAEGTLPRVLLTKREAALALGMSVRHFERHVQRRLRCVHSGQLTLYPVRDIERWANDEATLGGRGSEHVR
jgi:hypothetical protein